ncbi:GAF domain-containing protein [Streptomyces aurantiacus]|uniref:Putative Cell wall protein AWA1 n=1 Tax=Streptomyces aurantiacus JA 4570 TaxID=1286094 RepID=S4AMY8_9ACTN|nr:GAF domain-containing protein [Streptomyces aurantiacus]EPH42777.1 putative Cell wall protein AWA1 [Streptomyces aurantiacus JA 4570]
MTSGDGYADQAAAAWKRAAAARERAARAEDSALRHDAWAQAPGQELHEDMAAALRRTAACHRSSAQLQEAFARRAGRWAQGGGTPPRFMTGVAEACGTRSAALTLVDTAQSQLAVAASDELAGTAQDLEFMLGEGPTRDATTSRRPVVASRAVIETRWPCCGPALTALGVREVAAVPLSTSDSCLGALAVFDPRPGLVGTRAFADVVGALTRMVLLDPDADPELYGGTDHRDVVQQAAGMVSVHIGRPVDDALALIKARAFALSVPLETFARGIVAGDLSLTSEGPS